ncbi:MAG: hypothetical protein HUK08_02390 [Bacteroidaceae bacterium]|nr:hypothetical protein [Bacteroidaceae bacterium]
MSKKFYASIPGNYPVCECGDCPKAANCLHQIAYQKLMESEKYVRLINPRLCTKDDSCIFFRNATPMVYAFGFSNFQKYMLPHQYKMFMEKLIEVFGRNPYYERRRGATAMPKKEQDLILQTLRDVGVTQEMQFDKYIQAPNWDD